MGGLTLEQIITNGGPALPSLLFAYLWWNVKGDLKEVYQKLDAVKERELAKAEEDAKFYRDLAQRAGSNV